MADNRSHIITYDDDPISRNSHLDSEAYNDILNSLKTSALRSINRARKINSELTSFNKALIAENEYLSSKITEITSMTAKIGDSNTAIITGYDDLVSAGSSNYNNNKLFGQITCGFKQQWSKVVRYTDTDGKKKASLDTDITLDGTKMAHSDDIYNILDNRKNTFWLLDTTPESTHQIVINFPTPLKPHINSLQMIPFPAFGFDINHVYIHKTDSTIVDITPDGYQAATMNGLDMHFSPILWNGTITINLTARGNVLGISNLDLYLTDYFNSYATVKYEIPSFKTPAFTAIDSVDIMDFGIHEVINVDSSYNPYDQLTVTAHSDGVDTVISKETLLGNQPTEFNKPANTSFYISFKFKKFNDQTPIFRNAKITYRS